MGVGADLKVGVPEWVSGFFASPVQFYSPYAINYEFEGVRLPNYPFLGPQVIYRQAEDNPYNDVYLDVSAGSDAGVGCTAAAPLQTFLEALFRLRPDKINRIFLQQGQTIDTIVPGSMFHENGAVIQDLLIENVTLEAAQTISRPAELQRARCSRRSRTAPVSTPTGSSCGTPRLKFQDVGLCGARLHGDSRRLQRWLSDPRRERPCDSVGPRPSRSTAPRTPRWAWSSPWYGSAGFLTWDLEDTASLVKLSTATATPALGVSAYGGQGRLTVVGAAGASAIDSSIHATGYVGASYPDRGSEPRPEPVFHA